MFSYCFLVEIHFYLNYLCPSLEENWFQLFQSHNDRAVFFLYVKICRILWHPQGDAIILPDSWLMVAVVLPRLWFLWMKKSALVGRYIEDKQLCHFTSKRSQREAFMTWKNLKTRCQDWIWGIMLEKDQGSEEIKVAFVERSTSDQEARGAIYECSYFPRCT